MAVKLAPTQFNFPGMMSMGGGAAPNPNANGDMGAKLLQAALAQQKQGQTPQPQVGQTMPGGAMNIVPPQPTGIMGALGQGGPMSMGLLSKLFGQGGTFGQPQQPPVGQSGQLPGDAPGSSGAVY